MTLRKIIHIDMDAFYASVEQRDNPMLRGKPIAVGGGERRGVTTTASYEAREYGVRSAMPGYMAKRLCPKLIFVKPRFDAYRSVSRQVRDIFYQYTSLVEPLSLDEAYLDVSKNYMDDPSALSLAKKITSQIAAETALTCSAGVSYNKFLAKIASDLHKPNAISMIRPENAIGFLMRLDIEKFYGVGKVTARKMKSLGIQTGKDLMQWSKLDLAKRFGKQGIFYYDIVRGIDNRAVIPDQVRKSIAVERTLDENLKDETEIFRELEHIISLFYKRLLRSDNFGRTITLKLKTADFNVINRSFSATYFITHKAEIAQIANRLMADNFDSFDELRLIGLTASKLQHEISVDIPVQLDLKFE
jgi:DNA polymerase-4